MHNKHVPVDVTKACVKEFAAEMKKIEKWDLEAREKAEKKGKPKKKKAFFKRLFGLK